MSAKTPSQNVTGNDGRGINSLGTGLLEISALTALIGSSTAEQLALGDRGAAGLAWVGMSTFGSLSILKACVAASAPNWLRETLGVRNATTDAAVGLSLNLSSRYMDREDMARKNLKNAVGVTCERRKLIIPKSFFGSKQTSTDFDFQLIKRDHYAFDLFTQNALNSTVAFLPGSNKFPLMYIFQRDPHYKGPITHGDWISLSFTLGKVVELYVLYKLDVGTLSWVSGLNWFYFFISAALLQLMQLSSGYRRDFDTDGRLDIISGELPSTRRPARECRILLGTPSNFRHHILWTVIWMFGAVTCAISLVLCCILLSSRPPKAVYVWVAFQVFWLLCRSLFFHIAESTNKNIYPVHRAQTWERLSHGLKTRVLELILTLCKYQAHVHPRGSYSYCEDVMELDALRDLLAQCTLMNAYPLDLHSLVGESSPAPTTLPKERIINLTFRAVVGDTLLSSVAWFHGSKLTSMDLYDCCFVFLDVPIAPPSPPETLPTTRLVAVPVARSLGSVQPKKRIDGAGIESGRDVPPECEVDEMRISTPKGSPNMGIDDAEWCYWIPCTDGRLIQVSSVKVKVLGEPRRGEVMTGEEVTRKLGTGDLNISLEKVEMVWEVVDMARSVVDMLVNLFGAGLSVNVKRQS